MAMLNYQRLTRDLTTNNELNNQGFGSDHKTSWFFQPYLVRFQLGSQAVQHWQTTGSSEIGPKISCFIMNLEVYPHEMQLNNSGCFLANRRNMNKIDRLNLRFCFLQWFKCSNISKDAEKHKTQSKDDLLNWGWVRPYYILSFFAG